MKKKIALLFFLLVTSCTHMPNEESLSCVQIIDQNGLSETINQEEKLTKLNQVDFLSPQPYQRVVRIYQRNPEGKIPSVFTTYYPNGQIKQYLEVIDGRAYGKYQEWHSNGCIKVDATVCGGNPSLSTFCQKDWTFEGTCRIWDLEKNLIATIPYSKGSLHGEALYYFPSGRLKKKIHYDNDLLEGEYSVYAEDGSLMEKYYYQENQLEGSALGYFTKNHPSFLEKYEKGKLETGIYYDFDGNQVAEIQKGKGFKAVFEMRKLQQLIEYKKGYAEGLVEIFDKEGNLESSYYQTHGKKQGKEITFFLPHELPYQSRLKTPQPKLSVEWNEDTLHGISKTWYPTGKIASQKELYQNEKNGTCCGWYENGDLMYLEEYELGKLIHAKYYKKGQKEPVSKVVLGEGEATLFDEKTGLFLRRIPYRNGSPQ